MSKAAYPDGRSVKMADSHRSTNAILSSGPVCEIADSSPRRRLGFQDLDVWKGEGAVSIAPLRYQTCVRNVKRTFPSTCWRIALTGLAVSLAKT